jgi:hypothetical protein
VRLSILRVAVRLALEEAISSIPDCEKEITMHLNAHLLFNGNCEEAFKF